MELTALGAALEQLALERLPDGRFVPCGRVPPWCAALARPIDEGRAIDASEVFPFLSAFLPLAAEAWRGAAASVASDFWTEATATGAELHLEAFALRVESADVLVIRRNERLFEEQRLVLQRARELRLAHDALARELEERDVLAHAVVHDLTTPLRTVLGALSLLRQVPLADRAARWRDTALDAATRQRQLVSEIVDVFSAAERRLEAAPPRGAAIDLDAAVERALLEAQAAARRRDLRLELEQRMRPCLVRGEEARLLRIVANLLDNAIRRSPPGGLVALAIRREGDSIRLEVADEGTPVPGAALPGLFARAVSWQGGEARAALGLYFCRITVERWGGGIGYEVRGDGLCCFWIRLPAIARAEPFGGGA